MNRKEQVLIQVNDLFPPYCRIFSKKELYAKEKAIKKLNSVGVVKTKTFKISSNISPHDLQVKVNQCKKIFEKGDAVIFILLFPKREHPEKAQSILLPLYNKLEELIGESGKITKRFTIEDGVGTFTVQGNKVGAKQPD